MIMRNLSLFTFFIGCTLVLTGCQASLTEFEPMPATQLPQPIQLAYQPFGAIRYHIDFKDPGGRILVATDLSVTGERVGGHLVLTVRIIQGTNNGVSHTGTNGRNDIRLTIDDDGRITDFISKTVSQQIESADDPREVERMNGFLAWILPIYEKGPVSVGQIAAHTSSKTAEDGRFHFTMVLKGAVTYHNIQALRLDLDRLVYEQTFKPGTPESFPERGYFLVDPNNGAVLKARWVGADGGEILVETM
jgi:hypothetical protein